MSTAERPAVQDGPPFPRTRLALLVPGLALILASVTIVVVHSVVLHQVVEASGALRNTHNPLGSVIVPRDYAAPILWHERLRLIADLGLVLGWALAGAGAAGRTRRRKPVLDPGTAAIIGGVALLAGFVASARLALGGLLTHPPLGWSEDIGLIPLIALLTWSVLFLAFCLASPRPRKAWFQAGGFVLGTVLAALFAVTVIVPLVVLAAVVRQFFAVVRTFSSDSAVPPAPAVSRDRSSGSPGAFAALGALGALGAAALVGLSLVPPPQEWTAAHTPDPVPTASSGETPSPGEATAGSSPSGTPTASGDARAAGTLPQPSSSAHPDAHGLPRCTASDVKTDVTHFSTGYGGQTADVVAVNVSSRACALAGVPTVRVSQNGRALSLRQETLEEAQFPGERGADGVGLAPGQRAKALLVWGTEDGSTSSAGGPQAVSVGIGAGQPPLGTQLTGDAKNSPAPFALKDGDELDVGYWYGE